MRNGGQTGFFGRLFKSSWGRGRKAGAPSLGRNRARNRERLRLEPLERRELLALSAVGPIDATNGFPRYYVDSVGFALELCLDTAAPDGCILEQPNPAAPISFPDNFSAEMFYTRMDASMVTNGGGLALLVGATEAVNDGVPMTTAESFVFGRLRFRVDNLVVGATYTITHPWGVDVFTNVPATVLNRRMINDTTDIGCVPLVTIPGTCDMATVLNPANKVDTYLRWDPAVAPAIAPGFTGNFFVPHKAIGSQVIHPTLGAQNFFRIEGPNVGGPGSPNPCPDLPGNPNCIQTDLFNIVGKIAKPAISGMKFNDLNGDGAKTANEPGLSGWTIYLDTTPDGVLNNPVDGPGICNANATEPCRITGATGVYNFGSLDPGTYTVREVLKPGWAQTAPAGGSHTVVLGALDIVENRDFGNQVVVPPASLYLSLNGSQTLNSIAFADEDVIAFNGSTFAMYFDGSDVGIGGRRLDAFSIISATEILMSFDTDGTVTGLGTVDDSDIVKFTATSLGTTTSGTFSLYFDGSDVGLTTADEDVDAVEILSNGDLLISTLGNSTVTGLAGTNADEDILRFTPTSLGATTAGSWAVYFDGSDVGLTAASEDVDALALDPTGKIYLSTTGACAVPGVSAADEDVFVFTPTSLGTTTAGTFGPGLFFDGSAFGLAAKDVQGIDLPSAAPLLAGSGSVTTGAAAPLGPTGMTGQITVSVDAGVTAEQRQSIQGAIAAVNSVMGSTGSSLTLVDGGSAGIRLHNAATSACGGMADGVLGCATQGDVTMLSGWNWYTGSDAAAIGADQYDYQSAVAHELAHSLGLGHSDDPSSVLYHHLSPGDAHRDVIAHDMALADMM